LRTLKVVVARNELATARKAVRTVEGLCNVKEASVSAKVRSVPVEVRLVPNSARVGAQFKERTREVLKAAKPLAGDEALTTYLKGAPVKLATGSGPVEVPVSAFELEVVAAASTVAVEKGGILVSLGSERDEKLVAEGLVRDVARRLQALRKERGFVPTEVLRVAAVAGLEPDEVAQLRPMSKELAFLVRVKEVLLSSERTEGRDWFEDELDGRPVYLDVG
jgi:isoleucyl-tRNA synthetase